MSKNPKIFMFLHGYYYKDIRVKKEAKSLVKNGLDVTVYCLQEKDETYSKNNVNSGIKVIPVKKMTEEKRKTPMGMLLFWFCLLRSIWKINNITIIHAHDLSSLPPGILLKLLRRTKFVVFDSHEQFSDAVYDYYGPLAFGLTQLIENFCTKRSDLFLGVMKPQIELVKKRIKNYSNIYFSYIPNYPELTGVLKKPCFHVRNQVFRVIFLGSMQPERCYDQLIDASKILRKEDYSCEIFLIGDGPMYSHVMNRVRNENLEDMIILTGHLPQEEALEITCKGDVGLILVEPQRNMRSIMPNKYFEYLQLGLGLICVKANGIGLYMKRIDGVFIDDPMNPESIAQAVKVLYNDEERRKKMVLKAQQIIERKWNWSTCEKRLIDSYNALLSKI
ncbi:MAG: glycosyltransferase family 4 protein [Candidatus Hodarchaeota archaeon]